MEVRNTQEAEYCANCSTRIGCGSPVIKVGILKLPFCGACWEEFQKMMEGTKK